MKNALEFLPDIEKELSNLNTKIVSKAFDTLNHNILIAKLHTCAFALSASQIDQKLHESLTENTS